MPSPFSIQHFPKYCRGLIDRIKSRSPSALEDPLPIVVRYRGVERGIKTLEMSTTAVNAAVASAGFFAYVAGTYFNISFKGKEHKQLEDNNGLSKFVKLITGDKKDGKSGDKEVDSKKVAEGKADEADAKERAILEEYIKSMFEGKLLSPKDRELLDVLHSLLEEKRKLADKETLSSLECVRDMKGKGKDQEQKKESK